MANQKLNKIKHHVGASYRAPDFDSIHDVGGAIAPPYTDHCILDYSIDFSNVKIVSLFLSVQFKNHPLIPITFGIVY